MPGVRGGNGIDGANNGGKDHRGNSKALADNITREKPYISNMDHPVPMKPQWRHIVVDWMLEVCEEQEVGTEVFLLAVHYLDNFVFSTPIRKSQFQLAAATCLLIASKMLPHSTPFLISSLVDYTDNCYTKQEIVAWELLILHRLQWNLTTTTAAYVLRQLCSSSVRLRELHQEGLEVVVVVQAFLPLASLPSTTLALASLAWLSRKKEEREEVEELSKSLAVESHELDRAVRLIDANVDSLTEKIDSENDSVLSEEDFAWKGSPENLYVDLIQQKTPPEEQKPERFLVQGRRTSILC